MLLLTRISHSGSVCPNVVHIDRKVNTVFRTFLILVKDLLSLDKESFVSVMGTPSLEGHKRDDKIGPL